MIFALFISISSILALNNYSIDPCDGDSGAPLWITKRKESGDQNILVAIYRGGQESQKYFQPWCSATASKAHKMTDKVLAWIRKNVAQEESLEDTSSTKHP